LKHWKIIIIKISKGILKDLTFLITFLIGYLAIIPGDIRGVITGIFEISGNLPGMGVSTLGFH